MSNTSFGTKDSNVCPFERFTISMSSISSKRILSTVCTKTNKGNIKINIVTSPLNAPIKEPSKRSSKDMLLLGLILTLLSTSTSFSTTLTTLYLGYKRLSMI